LNYGDCAEYVASLINKTAELSKGKNPAVSTDMMGLFEKIRNQPNGGIVSLGGGLGEKGVNGAQECILISLGQVLNLLQAAKHLA